MQVGAGGTPGITYRRDLLTPAHLLISCHCNIIEMRVIRVHAFAVINKHSVTVTTKSLSAAGENHSAVRTGQHGSIYAGGNVQTPVESTPSMAERRGEDASRHGKLKIRHCRVSLASNSIC